MKASPRRGGDAFTVSAAGWGRDEAAQRKAPPARGDAFVVLVPLIGRPGSRHCRDPLSGRSECADLLRRRGLLVGGLVLVDDALRAGLVSLRDASTRASMRRPCRHATALRTRRMCVLSSDFTALLRRRAFSLVVMR